MPALLGDLCWREHVITITTTGQHGLNAGDVIHVLSMAPDRRWWMRLWARLLRRPTPTRMVMKAFRVNEAGWTSLWVTEVKK